MKAVVMAGGEGSRLRPLTSRRPKPLVPVAGTPIMEHILRLLLRHGISEVVVTLQYLGSEIRNYFGDGEEFGVHIEYVVEDQPLGTAGSVRNAAHLLDETFLVISGDALTDMDLTHVVGEHRARRSKATLVLSVVPNPLEFGVVVTEDDGSIRRFIEKPSWGEVISDQANTGTYVIEPEVLELIPPDVSCDWSQDVFPAMLRRRDPLFGVVSTGYWCDVGTIQTYLQANWDALEGRVQCEIAGRREEGNVWIGAGVQLHPGSRVEGPAFIGDEVRIGAGGFINGPACIDRYAVIEANSKVSNSIIMQHSFIGESARLRQSLVCRNVTVKNNVLLEENSVVGDDCVIGQGAHVAAGVKLWPNKEVQPGSTVIESVVWSGEWRQGLFSAFGLTGIVNVELTPDFSARLGAAFAATLPKGAVIAVCRDAARGSRMIKRAVISGLTSSGGRVRDLSELPVPVMQFAVGSEDCIAGVHVVESPVDRRSADIRLYDGSGMQIDKRSERKIENLFFREDFRRVAVDEIGDIEYSNPTGAYIDHLLSSVDVEAIRVAELRVTVDYDYSAASLVLPDVLSRLGVTAVPLHQGFDERFRGKPPDQFRAACEEMALISKTLHADLGCLISSSGERLWLADETGVLLDDDQALAAVALLTVRRAGSGRVVVPATAPHWLGGMVAAAGGTLVPTKVDPASIARAAATTGAELAGDGRGGIAWPAHLAGFDAMATLVRLLELRALGSARLSAVREELPTAVRVVRSEFCPFDAKGRVMRVLVEEHQRAGADIDLVEGLKVLVDGGYVLVLPDADTPYYQVVVSVDDEHTARRLLDEYLRRVREAQTAGGVRPTRTSVLEKG
jgi:mannose-1-phosphate guanylyltransferase/phosphomannomutase